MNKKEFCLKILSKISHKKHIVLTIYALLTFIFIILLLNLKFDNSINKYVDTDSKYWKNYLLSESSFSSTNDIKIIMDLKNGVFNPNSIKTIHRLQTELENIDSKILENQILEFYNDTYTNYIAFYFAKMITETKAKYKTKKQFNKIIKSQIYNTNSLFNFISTKNEYFKKSEAENIVNIFKNNSKYIDKIINRYSKFSDINNKYKLKTISSVQSFINVPYPVYALTNQKVILKNLLGFGISKKNAESFINYVLITKIKSIKEIYKPFLSFIGFTDNELKVLDNSKFDKTLTLISKNKYLFGTEKLVNDINAISEMDIEWIKLKILNWEYLKNTYFSKDLKKVLVKITPVALAKSESLNKTYIEIHKLIENYRWKYNNIIFTELGDPVLSFWTNKSIIKNTKIIILFFILFITLISLIILKQIPPIIFYIFSSASAIAWTFGIMSLANIEFNYLCSLLIPYSLALNIILTLYFYESFLRNKNVTDFINSTPIACILSVSIALLIASFFATSNANFIFFFFLFVNTFISTITNLLILPAYIRMTGFMSKINIEKPDFINKATSWIEFNKVKIVFTTFALVIIFIPGIRSLQIKIESYKVLSPIHFVYSAYENFNKNFYGAESLNLNFFINEISYTNEKVKELTKAIKDKLVNNFGIAKVTSVFDIDKTSPNIFDKQITSSYKDQNNLRMIINSRSSKVGYFSTIYKHVKSLIQKNFKFLEDKITFFASGELSLKYNIATKTIYNLYLISVIALLLCYLLFSLLNASIFSPLKYILPSLSSILIVLGIMGYIHLTIDFTTLAASIFTIILGGFISLCLKNISDFYKTSLTISICSSFSFLSLVLTDYSPFIKFGLVMFFMMLLTSILTFFLVPSIKFNE